MGTVCCCFSVVETVVKFEAELRGRSETPRSAFNGLDPLEATFCSGGSAAAFGSLGVMLGRTATEAARLGTGEGVCEEEKVVITDERLESPAASG